ncbi:MAG: hypothetical protein JWR83_2321 [Aeromicrobium sp.]|nr:hypothetical protein [Aeromicrobium sp.]
MTSESDQLRKQLRGAGVAPRALNAVWPAWWSADAELSSSAQAELRYTLARRLGISPRSLFDGEPKFLWRNEARFKNLGTLSPEEASILVSYGVSAARVALGARPAGPVDLRGLTATALRETLVSDWSSVNLKGILTFCWSIGIPVLQLRLFPLEAKKMAAMSVRVGDRYAILLGRETTHPAQLAFIVAHELAHIASGDIDETGAALDVEDPIELSERDSSETGADSFALELLTGDPAPEIKQDRHPSNSASLVKAVRQAGQERGIDPATLALCWGHTTGDWRLTFAALKSIGPADFNGGDYLNELAVATLDWSTLSDESADSLHLAIGQ